MLFQYPFDGAEISKKRRSLKKQLLADGTKRLKKKIAILGGSTTNDIAALTELFLLDNGIEPELWQSEYNRYWQDAMFPPQELLEFKPDIIFIHTSNRNVTRYPDVTWSAEQIDAEVKSELSRFTAMWDNLRGTFGCPIIQNNFEMPFFRLLGNSDAVNIHGRTALLNRLNEAFYACARENKGFYINDINYLSACAGLDKWSDPLYWNMYKYAVAVPCIPDFAFNLAHIIKSVFGKNKKAIACDLDNTLWGGIVGDDGVDGIAMGQEIPMGQAYAEFQSYLKELKKLGVLLTVASKNDYENAVAGLNHPDGVLRPDDFVVIKANWEPKDVNIAQTAAELNILPESIVFADDNPAERHIVSAQLGIEAPALDGVENYIRTIDRNGYFEVTDLSADDLKRNEMYKANAERAAMQAAFRDYGEYLTSLEMTATIDGFKPIDIQRITQLTNKSNQFNLTTKRYTVEEIQSAADSDEKICLCGRLSDKFGDNGIVSVVIGAQRQNELHIELWLMSCRVLKRDMELAMLDTLVARAREKGITRIIGYYYPTAKNGMVKSLFGDFGFKKTDDSESGTVWQLDLDGYENRNKYITVERSSDNA